MSLATSACAFTAALAELGLSDLAPKFNENGWNTFNAFAFSSSDPQGRDGKAFEEQVLPELIEMESGKPATPAGKQMIPKLRMLYAQSYSAMAAAMETFANPKPLDERLVMNPADRGVRTRRLKDRISGFKLEGHNHPSQALIDRLLTILLKGAVRYTAWEKCTSQSQELMDEPEIKGLRLDPVTGTLMQDVAPDKHTDLASELLWDFAVRRRACAGDISALIAFESMNEWHEDLKAHLLEKPPPGYRKVSWSQLLEADKALWRYVQEHCPEGTRAQPGATVTEFEKHWLIGMQNPRVRAHLQFLQGSSSSHSAASSGPSAHPGQDTQVAKLNVRIDQLGNELRNAKRKPGDDGRGWRDGRGERRGAPRAGPRWRGAGQGQAEWQGQGSKGKGKAKFRSNGANADMAGFNNRSDGGQLICFNYNRACGCPDAPPGKRCSRGVHICIKCQNPSHGMASSECPNR